MPEGLLATCPLPDPASVTVKSADGPANTANGVTCTAVARRCPSMRTRPACTRTTRGPGVAQQFVATPALAYVLSPAVASPLVPSSNITRCATLGSSTPFASTVLPTRVSGSAAVTWALTFADERPVVRMLEG